MSGVPGDNVEEPIDHPAAFYARQNAQSILQFFEYSHLKPELGIVSSWFHDLAMQIVHHLPSNPERSVALRKLLEAKDAAVRAKLFK